MVDIYLCFRKHLGHLLVNANIAINCCHEGDAVCFGYLKKFLLLWILSFPLACVSGTESSAA
jgi:hypothetical protein